MAKDKLETATNNARGPQAESLGWSAGGPAIGSRRDAGEPAGEARPEGAHSSPGVIGYEETVIPQLVNAILSRHHIILLGLRGQAKSRILRSLVDLLDDEVPVIAGCEINDNPYAPLCRACRDRVAEQGDRTAIAWLPRERRYVEKLATPDVTIADIIGDVDPIRAARGGLDLSNELTIHYGLLPRANRGIFAINELPDLAGKIQVGLFNIMQEGDIQIKGYPVRLKLDVALVFSANPEDYTARGKIITPAQGSDRLRDPNPLPGGRGPRDGHHGAGGVDPPALRTADLVPDFIQEVVEQIAFAARESKHMDRRSGVSQRLPISCLENVVSSAERRAVRERRADHRPAPVGRVRGHAVHHRQAGAGVRGRAEGGRGHRPRPDQGGHRPRLRARLGGTPIQGDGGLVRPGGRRQGGRHDADGRGPRYLPEGPRPGGCHGHSGCARERGPGPLVSACEFILEGLHVQQKIDRTEQRGYTGAQGRSGRHRARSSKTPGGGQAKTLQLKCGLRNAECR